MLSEIQIEAASDAGVLDPVIHERIIGNIDALAKRSNIPQTMITKSMVGVCTEEEIEYMKKLKKISNLGTYAGFMFVGDPQATKKFQTICGFLLRNFMDGVVMSASEAVDSGKQVALSCQVLLIPDFYRDVEGAGKMAWKADVLKLVSLLEQRRMSGGLTLIQIDTRQGVKESFGPTFLTMLDNNYFKL